MDGKEQNWLLIKRSDDHEVDSVVQGTYKPMLATLDTSIPHGDDWAYEVKFDGFRAVAYIRGGECKLVSRNDNDLTGRFPEVAKAIVKAVKSPNAVIDGEITPARSDRQVELLRAAARGGPARLLRVRPARARRRAAHRPGIDRAQGAAA